jgi:uncharacterized protein YgiM (DUF1202 family)
MQIQETRMRKHQTIVALALLSLTTLPAYAQDWPELNKENVGKGIGAIAGAVIGSNIGGGRGRTAAIAAGTLAGYWTGGKVGRHFTEPQHIAARPGSSKRSVRPSCRTFEPALERLPPIELVNAYYYPTTNINVRGGPGTNYVVTHTIPQGKRVPVVGRVVDSDWYLIAERGKASGFLYAPLMAIDFQQSAQHNAIRDAASGTQFHRIASQNPTCRTITLSAQAVNSGREAHTFQACQQANGNWVKI